MGTGSNYVKGKSYVTGLDKLEAYLGIVQKRLVDPLPVLKEIAMLFSAMEAERFANQGASANFGTTTWDAISEATMTRRQYPDRKGGSAPGGFMALDAHGFLREAAVHPLVSFADLGSKMMNITINPADKGANTVYKRQGTSNYAVVQETGDSHVPQRMFVEITPQFRLMAKNIAANYFLAKEGKDLIEIPVNYKAQGA